MHRSTKLCSIRRALVVAIIFVIVLLTSMCVFGQAPLTIQLSDNTANAESSELRELREAVQDLRAEVAELRSEIKKQRQQDEPQTRTSVEPSPSTANAPPPVQTAAS